MVLSTRKTGKKLIWMQLYLILFEGLLISWGVPSSLTYLTDIINALLTLLCVRQYRRCFSERGYVVFIRALDIYIVVLLMGDAINLVSPFLILWAFRNSFRLIFFFMNCVVVLKEKDMLSFFDKTFFLVVVNFFFALFQYFVQGKSWDYLGGLFGTTVGCNAGVNIFCCLMTIYYVNAYLNGKVSLFKTSFVVITSLIIAALAEITVMLVEIPLLVFIALFVSKPSFKTVGAGILIFAGVGIGFYIFQILFPAHFKYIQSIDAFIEGASGVGGGYNISRLTAIQDITRMFFGTDAINRLFGFGFGACEYSSISVFSSDFYGRYGSLNYRWFDLQIRFLETGYLGIALFIGLFVVLTVLAIINRRKLGDNSFALGVTISLLVLTIISCFYNAVLRTENGYLLFYFWAFVPVCLRPRTQEKQK